MMDIGQAMQGCMRTARGKGMKFPMTVFCVSNTGAYEIHHYSLKNDRPWVSEVVQNSIPAQQMESPWRAEVYVVDKRGMMMQVSLEPDANKLN